MDDDSREVRKVIGTFEMWDGRRGRKVLASYGDGTTRWEIEVATDDEDGADVRYTPRYAEIEDSDL